MSELNDEFRAVIVKNTFLELDDSDSEQDAPLMCKLKTEPAPRRPSFDEFLSDSSEEVDDQNCSSEVSTDDECPVAAPKAEAISGLSLPIQRRTVRSHDELEQLGVIKVNNLRPWSKSVNYDSSLECNFVTTTPSTVRHLTPRMASEGFAATPSTLYQLTPRSKSVNYDSNQTYNFVTTTPSTVHHLTPRMASEGFAATPSTVYHLSPRSKSLNYDSNQTYNFVTATPSIVHHLTPRMASEGPNDEICNSAQACTAQFCLGAIVPETSAAVNVIRPPRATSGRSLVGIMSIEKTAWEKFEEVVDGAQEVLSSYHGLVVDVKVAEGAHGWTVTVFVEPELLMSSREKLDSVAKQALILAAMALEGVYVVGCLAQPFTPTDSGFGVKLAVMTDPERACWDTFTTGVCHNPGCCQKQHLKRQNSAGLEVMFKPFSC